MKQNKYDSKKSKKRLFKPLIWFVAIQTILLFLSFTIITDCAPLQKDQMNEITIIVEDKAHWKGWNEGNFSVFFESTEYRFPHSPSPPFRELEKDIQRGDKLAITYVEYKSLFQKYNLIVEAQTETDTYFTVEEYMEEQELAYVLSWIFFIIAEIIFLMFFFMYVWLNL